MRSRATASNARQAMPNGGTLTVRTRATAEAVVAELDDTGHGIPPDVAPQVFEPFYTTKDAGSGLGLSLSRQIVERHGGALACESMVGVGTTFIVRLPTRAGDRSASDDCGGPSKGSSRR